MKTDEKVEQIRRLLDVSTRRRIASGHEWCLLFNEEESIREALDPEGAGYDRAGVFKRGMLNKLVRAPIRHTESVSECEELMLLWMPKAVCRFDGVAVENVRGSAAALSETLMDYPMVADYLKTYSSIHGARKHSRETQKAAAKELEATQKFEEYRARLTAWADSTMNELNGVSRYAGVFAQSWLVATAPAVKRWIKENGANATPTPEFIAIVKQAWLDKSVKDAAVKAAKKTAPYVPSDSDWLYGCAHSQYRGVWLGNRSGKNDITDSFARNVRDGYHPPYDRGNGGAKAVMTHELGHVLDYMTEARKDQKIKSVWSANRGMKMIEGLSEYANENIAEMIAEGFAEYRLCKPRAPLLRLSVSASTRCMKPNTDTDHEEDLNMNTEGINYGNGEDIYEELGCGPAMSWLTDDPDDSYTPVYNAFLENNCRGILTEDEARQAYARYSGRPPKEVQNCPEIDALAATRRAVMQAMGTTEERALKDGQLSAYLSAFYPYEPLLKHAY